MRIELLRQLLAIRATGWTHVGAEIDRQAVEEILAEQHRLNTVVRNVTELNRHIVGQRRTTDKPANNRRSPGLGTTSRRASSPHTASSAGPSSTPEPQATPSASPTARTRPRSRAGGQRVPRRGFAPPPSGGPHPKPAATEAARKQRRK